MWWGLNRSSKDTELTLLSRSHETSTASEEIAEESESIEVPAQAGMWSEFITMARALLVTAGYLLILTTMLSLLQPDGLGWTVTAIAAALGAGTAALFLIKRATLKGVTTVFGSSKN
jgi:small-conductance mechanosensitive channel